MSSSCDPPALFHLQEAGSPRTSERLGASLYAPPGGLGPHTVCIPSPYTDCSQDYAPPPHGPLTFYNSSLVAYERQPMGDPGSGGSGPPLSPSLFWPTQTPHQEMTSLAPHCPPHPPPMYGETPAPGQRGGPWVEAKTLGLSSNRSLLSSNKMGGKRQEEGLVGGAGGRADMHFCAVCQDYASGYHYGVWSCEGCKAFFKRSIQGHNDYICPATNQCTIDKNRRKSCQACRLRKCYEVGMMKCGVRRERCSYRGARQRRGAGRDPAAAGVRGGGAGQGGALMGPGAQQGGFHLEGPLLSFLPPLGQAERRDPPAMSPEQFISCIMEAEPPEIYLREDLKKPFTQSSMMMSLTHLADKELVLMISWAKKIPGFVELSLADQIQLLKCCWLEVLMLGLMWRSVDHPGKLIFSPDLKLNREEGSCVEGIMEIFDMLLSATSRFRELNLQREEYVCLKAMILLNSNMCTSVPETAEEVESRSRLLRLLDLVIDALVWAISKLGLSSQEQTLRLGHLTMLLSHIRHVSNKGMDHLSTMKRKNVVFVYDLLLEMLDANTSTGGHMTSQSSTSDTFSHQPTGPDLQGSGESAMSPSPEHSTLLSHTQDQAPSLGSQLLGPPPPEAHRACAAMEGDGFIHGVQWLGVEPPLGAEPDYSLGGAQAMDTI